MLRFICICFILFATSVVAQNKKIELVSPEQKILRQGSIISLQLAVKTNFATEGKFSFRRDNVEIFSTGKFIISPQTANRYQVTIPSSTGVSIYWDIYFVTEQEEYFLDTVDAVAHNFIISTTRSSISILEKTIVDTEEKINKYSKNAYTSPNLIDVKLNYIKNIPSEYWGYLMNQITIVDNQALLMMTKEQENAVLDWTRMGGSLCLEVDSLHDLPKEFSLAIADAKKFIENKKQGYFAYYYGWGRIVVWEKAVGDINIADESLWLNCTLFLYKVHMDNLSYIALGKTPDSIFDNSPTYGGPDETLPFTFITGYLLPDTIKVVPTGLVAFLLIAFLILVGPVEYIILKKMRKLVLTWITLPVMTFAFWLLCQWLASYYMGNQGGKQSLQIVNIDNYGKEVSIDNFSLSIFPLAATMENPVQNAITTELDIQTRNHIYQNFDYDNKLLFSGQFPKEYTVKRNYQPWTTYIERYYQKGSEQIHDLLSLDEIEKAMQKTTPIKINYNGEPRDKIKIYDSYNWNESNWIHSSELNQMNHISIIHAGNVYVLKHDYYNNYNSTKYRSQYYTTSLYESIVSLSFFSEKGLFCQFSPGAGDNPVNDLLLHDPDNDDQVILVCAKKNETQIVVFRQLFYRK